MLQKTNVIRLERAQPQRLVVPDPDHRESCDDAEKAASAAVTRATGAGFGLALRDAEAALYTGRLFLSQEATGDAVRHAITRVRTALVQMEASLHG